MKILVLELNLFSCSFLRIFFLEVVGRGFELVKVYLKRFYGGFIECRRIKFMFVGFGEVGKIR